jgi:hypothetical protein
MMRAFQQADKDSRKELRAALRDVGHIVRRDAASLLVREDPKHARSAAGYKVYVRQRGVSVEQSLRRTTGNHPEFGKFQARHALFPAAEENRDEVEREFVHALEKVEFRFNHAGV